MVWRKETYNCIFYPCKDSLIAPNKFALTAEKQSILCKGIYKKINKRINQL